mmetsp:Transcript_20120/g.50063  ORF Transcript_20120/g.50063 Transcript_20120/m.50063 type:complete len:200 (+) Transcript_20120:197-796(+)|eukprot:CAMPEP_0116100394 /NCGR_PEP_ID=MMETSP0327-20121206/12268_1 /TAXON_ID=44447 /ORGANISM="Pseudo-nitzschia delicatissima, Strain B596" /LENGTH=199 /DNA_ID=CAMNT_0003592315 /DNA_START=102 /DNA_END=701 /DNA_ORIENTATION=-
MPSRVIVMNQNNRVVHFNEDDIVAQEKEIPGSIKVRDPSAPKKVHWKPDERLAKKYYSLSKKDMPPEEKQSYWYNKSDDKKIFAQAKMTVKMIMMGKPFDEVTNTGRGLECKTRNESMKRVKAKKKVKHTMKIEQELQRLEGISNPERLAVAIAQCTKELSEWAQQQGIEDEREVQGYMYETRQWFRLYEKLHSVPSSE